MTPIVTHCRGEPIELVLASASPRRRDILRNLGIGFIAESSDVDEDFEPGSQIESIVCRLAETKARAVVQSHPSSLIAGADTLVALDHAILAKPRDAADAAVMLHDLSGRDHVVHTAVVLLDGRTGEMASRLVQTKVSFRNIDEEEIAAYVATGEPLDKAGAYGMQGLGATFVNRIQGDYWNVVGLPVGAFNDLLKAAGCCLLCRRLAAMAI